MIKEKTYYRCPNWMLLVYPTQEKAAMAFASAQTVGTTITPAQGGMKKANFSSKELEYKVCYIKPKDLIFVVERVEGEGAIYLFCLFPHFSGWIAKWEGFEKALQEVNQT